MRKFGRAAGRAVALLATGLVLLCAAWLGAALVLGSVDGAGDKGEPGAAITVGVISNGYHASLVLPAVSPTVDWRTIFDPGDTGSGAPGAAWLILGWGDRAFYMETRTIADVRPLTLVRALAGLGDTALQAIWIDDPRRFSDIRYVQISPARYRRMVAQVLARAQRGADGRAILHAGKGYGGNDAFYAAHGRYSPWRTCNEWVADVLRAGGIAVPVWAPLPQPLLWSLPDG
jgi:uncharacterized protein (TIGR02117 family)